MRWFKLEAMDDEAVAEHIDGGETLGFHAWDVFPSRSGGMERVECFVSGRDGRYEARCEVLPAEPGQRAESWTEDWSAARLRAKLAAVRSSDRPDTWWV